METLAGLLGQVSLDQLGTRVFPSFYFIFKIVLYSIFHDWIQEMAKITDLEKAVNIKTLKFVLLSIATIWLYNLIWISRNNKAISTVTGKEIVSETYVIWIAVCLGVGGLLSDSPDDDIMVFGLLIAFSSSILYTIWSFKARSAIQEYTLKVCKIDFKMNAFYTLIFGVFYINYCCNDLPEEFKRQKMIQRLQKDLLSEESLI